MIVVPFFRSPASLIVVTKVHTTGVAPLVEHSPSALGSSPAVGPVVVVRTSVTATVVGFLLLLLAEQGVDILKELGAVSSCGK